MCELPVAVLTPRELRQLHRLGVGDFPRRPLVFVVNVGDFVIPLL
jgi:hypothetical protein